MKHLGHIALIAAAALGVYLYVRGKAPGKALAGNTAEPQAQLAWNLQRSGERSLGRLLDPTIKGSPGQMAVGLFASNVRDD